MRNNDLLIERIDEGIKYIQDQMEKLDPVLSYLSEQIIERKEELDTREIFEYFVRLEELKVNSLLVETKMREILNYK